MKDYVAENKRILDEWRDSYVNNIAPEWPDRTKEELAKYFAQITTINLIDNEEVFVSFTVGSRTLTETIEYTILQLETTFFVWLITHHEILIAVILVELHLHHSVFIFLTHYCISEPFGGKSFPHAWCSLKNQVLLSEY